MIKNASRLGEAFSAVFHLRWSKQVVRYFDLTVLVERFKSSFPGEILETKYLFVTRKWNTLAFTVSTGATSAQKYFAVSALPGAADEPPRAVALRGLT